MNYLQKLEKHLESNHLKMTDQRRVILETFESIDHHVSLEELLVSVQQRKSGVGLATIYRTMKLFVAAGIVEEHRFDDGITRYELAKEGEHHDHLICLQCGKIIEFEDEVIEQQQNAIAKRFGMRITNHKMELYGRCIDQKACLVHKRKTGYDVS